MKNKIIYAVKDPWKILEYIERKLEHIGFFDSWSDEAYLKMRYFVKLRKKLNLKNPTTFNEKLQWLKIYNRNPEYTLMVDKFEAKKYVAERIGEKYIIPNYGVWDSFDDIDFDALPNQFVLKCTHDSGGLVICRDKSKLDLHKAKVKIENSLRTNYYLKSREWPYKNVKPRIIAEQYMENSITGDLKDYKFFCFGGVMKCFKIDFDRFVEHHANYYDSDKNLLHFGETLYPPVYDKQLDMPSNYSEMVKLAEKLSSTTPFLRADFYDVNGEIYFGECTLYPAGGFGEFTSEEWNLRLGNWINIPGGAMLIKDDIVSVLRWQIDVSQSTISISQSEDDANELIDYKFFCFNGNPRLALVCSERFSASGLKEDFFDEEWHHVNLQRKGHPNSNKEIQRPKQFDQMMDFAKVLSENIPFSRIDFYEVGNKVYFGEITLFPSGGFEGFIPEEWDTILGQWLTFYGKS